MRGGERHLGGSVDGNQHRHLGSVVGYAVRSLAAPGVAADYGESMPSLRDLQIHIHLRRVHRVHEQPFTVDCKGEMVVEVLADVPAARLGWRHLEPAVEPQLRPVEPRILPARVLPVEVCEVSDAHERVFAERSRHVPRRAADRIAVGAVEDASPLSRLWFAVAELHPPPRRRHVLRHA